MRWLAELPETTFFPATIVTGDPFVADELVLPTVSNQQTGTGPSVGETDIGVGLQKSITPDFGFSIGSDWTHLDQAGPQHDPNGLQSARSPLLNTSSC